VWYLQGMEMDRPLLVERQFYGQDSLTYYLDPNPYDPPGNGLSPDNYAVALHYDHAGRIDEGTISGQSVAGTYGMKVEWPDYDVRLFGARITRHGEPAAWMGGLIDQMRDGSGLMYLRNRYYDPNTGRFTQEDPIGLAGGLNLYGFAGGDPVSFSDPFGLCPFCLIPVAIAAEDIAATAIVGAIDWIGSNWASDQARTGWNGEMIPTVGGRHRGEDAEVQKQGDLHGCMTFGERTSGTSGGNWIRNHVPPTSVKMPGEAQFLGPHCQACSNKRGTG
jgi:RHS repeat-associated protein